MVITKCLLNKDNKQKKKKKKRKKIWNKCLKFQNHGISRNLVILMKQNNLINYIRFK